MTSITEPPATSPQVDGTRLPDLVERWAAATPDAVAVRYGARTWTWREWSDRIRRLAAGLSSLGIARGDRIAFLDKNHPACLETAFAATTLGAAVAILNWRLSGDELAYAMTDSGARVLIVGDEFADLATSAGAGNAGVERVLTVSEDGDDEYEAFLAAHQPLDVVPGVDPEDAGLLIYSSGTTGRPKGVVLTQRALMTHTRNVGTRFPFAPGDINLVAMPMFHVGGVCWAFLGIQSGNASIVLRNPDAASLLGGIAAGATHTFFVPPVISGLLAAGEQATAALAGLKRMGYGAAPMPLSTLRKAIDAWPHIDFVQVYGQTEIAGVAVTLQPDDHRDPQRSHLLKSAGVPVPGVEVRIVDVSTGEEVPTGEQGEIWFRSAQVMSCYLNRPDATAETITADGWLRTGDIGHVDTDGYVYVEDRLKDMIITGGENVYSPEVERVLAEHPNIVDAAVIGVPDEKWGESVKALVTVDAPVSAQDIIAFCRQHLASYKCPSTVDFVEALPRNASGKLLKRDLRTPYWSKSARSI